MKVISPAIGLAILNLRTKMKLSRDGLAKNVGVSSSWLYHIEKHGKVPAADILAKIASGLGTTDRKLQNAAKRLEKSN